MRSLSIVVSSVFVLFFYSYVSAEDNFPGRSLKQFNDVPVIELLDLHARFTDTIVVDTRSKFEFDTLKIKNAINVPIALKSFDQEILSLREKTNRPIAFYCNGHTCMKSYMAVKRAMSIGVSDVYAYDAGIFNWAKAYPDKAELLGKSPVNIQDIISKNDFKKRVLNPDLFSEKVTDDPSKVIVLDIRDKYQRAGVGFFPMQERWAELNKMEKIYTYIKKAKRSNKTLFIYDEVGKQVRWLQYALEKEGLKNYYFMERGATGYYKMISKFGK